MICNDLRTSSTALNQVVRGFFVVARLCAMITRSDRRSLSRAQLCTEAVWTVQPGSVTTFHASTSWTTRSNLTPIFRFLVPE
jgi:hypothetical protein